MNRLQRFIIPRLAPAVLVLGLAALPSPALAVHSTGLPEIVPERDVIQEDLAVPRWKELWDQARTLSRQEDHAAAARCYEELLRLRPRLEEARWEYGRLLSLSGRWADAAEVLSVLVEEEPDNPGYRLELATAALAAGRYRWTVDICGRLLRGSGTADARVREEGLALLLRALDRVENPAELLPLLEELVRALPADVDLLRKTAEIALESGSSEEALALLGQLALRTPRDEEVLRRLAALQEELDSPEHTALTYERLLELVPDDLDLRLRLAGLYRRTGKTGDEVAQLDLVLRRRGGDVDLLARAAELYVDLDKPDRALQALRQALELRPGDPALTGRLEEVRALLIDDFLVLIENNGADLLWQDLATLGPEERTAVFARMAEVLREKHRHGDLAEVLRLLLSHDPHNRKWAMELARLAREQGEEEGVSDLARTLGGYLR